MTDDRWLWRWLWYNSMTDNKVYYEAQQAYLLRNLNILTFTWRKSDHFGAKLQPKTTSTFSRQHDNGWPCNVQNTKREERDRRRILRQLSFLYLPAAMHTRGLRRTLLLVTRTYCGVLCNVNDIAQAAPGVQVKLFADDTNLFLSGIDISELICRSNNCLESLNRWCIANRLHMNFEKNECYGFFHQ